LKYIDQINASSSADNVVERKDCLMGIFQKDPNKSDLEIAFSAPALKQYVLREDSADYFKSALMKMIDEFDKVKKSQVG
jgi:hypothetical protein